MSPTISDGINVILREQLRPLLGRQVVHDERSRSYARGLEVDRSTWRSKRVRIIDPLPNPNQHVGCCTMAAKASQMNSRGNRKMGVVLKYPWAVEGYRLATRLDPFPGAWEPEDTGSSALASCKAAQQLGVGGVYRWHFGGVDESIQSLMVDEMPSLGTWWRNGMFYPDKNGLIRATGSYAGGHQYVLKGYDKKRDWCQIRCWWGEYRDVWIQRQELGELLMDDGDSHFQERVI